MAQPSVANYFNSRKRSAYEENKLNSAKKVLVLDSNNFSVNNKHCPEVVKSAEKNEGKIHTDVSKSVDKKLCRKQGKDEKNIFGNKILSLEGNRPKLAAKRNTSNAKNIKNKKPESLSNSTDIQLLLKNMKKTTNKEIKPEETMVKEVEISGIESHITPPSTPVKSIVNALDRVKEKVDGPSLKEIKRKMSRSSRLAELKASLVRFQDNANKLKVIEEKTNQISESPKLKTFKTIELEIQTSPQKVFSPEKAYLSPKKDRDTPARRNLMHVFGPTKNAVPLLPESPSKQILEETSKSALTLPYKYRFLAEIFRSIDTVCQILFNRKETITFRKLKPAVEEMLKRNLLEKHLNQIKYIYPDAFEFCQEKLKVFGSGMHQERWELVIKPKIGDAELFNSDILLQRRRKLFNILIEKVKDYHHEFLSSLDPPIIVSKSTITRWHPEFDIEMLPDFETDPLPQPPNEEKFTTGKDVLEKARQMFNCNTRMEQALQKLKEAKEKNEVPSTDEPKPLSESVLKGIPKALLEKVRQKQAAKALMSMTRSADKEKELQIYSRLPEIARLTRNLYVSEKKSVLPLEVVVEKLGNCYRGNLPKAEMEEHLKIIAKELPTWLIIHNIRNCIYLKIAKNDDLSLIIRHLENLTKQKSEL